MLERDEYSKKAQENKSWLGRFLSCESGMATADFVVIVGAVVGLAVVAVAELNEDATTTASNTSATLDTVSVVFDEKSADEDSDAPAGYDAGGRTDDDWVGGNNDGYGSDDNSDIPDGAVSIVVGGGAGGSDDPGDQASQDISDGSDPQGPGADGTDGDAVSNDGDVAGGDAPADDANNDIVAADDTDSVDIAGDEPAGDDGSSGDNTDEPNVYDQYVSLYNELYATLDTPELDCFRNNGEIRINKKGNLPRRCRGLGLEELIDLQNQVYPA